MEPEFRSLENFVVQGLAADFTLPDVAGIPALWQNLLAFSEQVAKVPGPVSYGVCDQHDTTGEAGKFRYTAAFEVRPDAPSPIGVVRIELPAARYAVFTHKGPVAQISQTYCLANTTWLPESGYELYAGFDFERYDERFGSDPQDPENLVEIWLPIRKA